MPRIVLASQSTSRRRLLEDAGLKPTIIVSNVDEETDFFNAMHPADMVIALAITKAHTVREQIDFPIHEQLDEGYLRGHAQTGRRRAGLLPDVRDGPGKRHRSLGEHRHGCHDLRLLFPGRSDKHLQWRTDGSGRDSANGT